MPRNAAKKLSWRKICLDVVNPQLVLGFYLRAFQLCYVMPKREKDQLVIPLNPIRPPPHMLVIALPPGLIHTIMIM